MDCADGFLFEIFLQSRLQFFPVYFLDDQL